MMTSTPIPSRAIGFLLIVGDPRRPPMIGVDMPLSLVHNAVSQESQRSKILSWFDHLSAT
jgi:hypothetical protein